MGRAALFCWPSGQLLFREGVGGRGQTEVIECAVSGWRGAGRWWDVVVGGGRGPMADGVWGGAAGGPLPLCFRAMGGGRLCVCDRVAAADVAEQCPGPRGRHLVAVPGVAGFHRARGDDVLGGPQLLVDVMQQAGSGGQPCPRLEGRVVVRVLEGQAGSGPGGCCGDEFGQLGEGSADLLNDSGDLMGCCGLGEPVDHPRDGVRIDGRHAELIKTGVDGDEQTGETAAVPGVEAVGFRVVDHFVDRGVVGMPAGHQPALGMPGWVVGRRFLGWCDDQRAAVGELGADDVVAESVLDGALQSALPKERGEVAVPVLLFRGASSCLPGERIAGACGDACAL